MKDTLDSLRQRVSTLEHDNARLFAGFQAATRGEIKWYARASYDGTSFRFGVLGLTRADGGHIVIQSKVGRKDTPYTVCYLIDDAVREMRNHCGGDYYNVMGGHYHKAERLRNDALRTQEVLTANDIHPIALDGDGASYA